jgi:hypothetical protein
VQGTQCILLYSRIRVSVPPEFGSVAGTNLSSIYPTKVSPRTKWLGKKIILASRLGNENKYQVEFSHDLFQKNIETFLKMIRFVHEEINKQFLKA